ncbi:uncharacterized protein TNCV_3781581 [Trichonephila clavipes]|nr:uncharacterized protein TNCV_3781581 [Trichonephila clavipes]
MDYENGQEEPDSFRKDKIYAGILLSYKLEKHLLKIDTNSERSMTFQKSFDNAYLVIVTFTSNWPRPSSQKLLLLYVAKNKSIEILLSSDESDFECIPHREMRALDYDE